MDGDHDTRPAGDGAGAGPAPASPGAALSKEAIRAGVAEVLGQDPGGIGDDDDLLLLGVDSVRIMRLAGQWRRRGVAVPYTDLVTRPTVGQWWALVASQLPDGGAAEPGARADGAGASRLPDGGAAEPGARADGAGAAPVDDGEPFPLTPMQQAYWIGRAEGQALGGVGAHFYVEFDGAGVGADRLEQAVRRVVDHHGMLRARFLADGRQQVLPASPWPGLRVHDLREAPDPGVALERLRAQLSHRRLAVEEGEVFDVQLTLLAGGRTRVHVDVDMLVCDAQSFQAVLRDLARCYAEPGWRPPAAGYGFAAYVRAAVAEGGGPDHEEARAYWQERVPRLPGAPQLPLATDPQRLERHRVGRRHHLLAPAQRAALERGARSHRLTPSAVIATAFAEVLGAFAAEPRFLLNLPLFGRQERHPRVGEIVGDFTSLEILAVDVAEAAPFAAQAQRLQERLHADIGHAAYSGVEVLRDLARQPSGAAMAAPVVFTSALGMGDLYGEEVRAALGDPVWASSQTPQVWLDYQAVEHAGGVLLNWDVVEDLFPPGLAAAAFAANVALLERLCADDRPWLEPVGPLLPPEQLAARERVNATAGPLPPGRLHDGFFRHAARDPGALAVAWGASGRLTYGELAQRALGVAGALDASGVRPGQRVGVALPRGPDAAAAVLGVLAAGAAYVPVGEGVPPARRAAAYATAGVRVALTDGAPALRADGWGGEVLGVAAAGGHEPLPAPVPGPAEETAYVIFTSGSTGAPKGVEMAHGAALNTVQDVCERYGLGASDRVLAVSALDFDLSVFDLFGLWSVGGAAVLPSGDEQREARRWLEALRRWDVTVWNSVPALCEMLLAAAAAGPQDHRLRLALLSGDWVAGDLPQRVRARFPACRVVALGGATEAAIWSNAYEPRPGDEALRALPYGFPLRNQRYRAVDGRGRDRPDWVTGELEIAGAGLAGGYAGDPQRTAEAFVVRDGRRWYRTGDLGRYRPDGVLEFLGRHDARVKVRGHRIELGEIEAVLAGHPRVERAVAATFGQPPRVGAVVVAPGPAPEPEALRRFAAGRLPHYMVPRPVVVLGELPLGPNGKVDGAALRRALEGASAPAAGEPPRGPTEAALAGAVREVLGVAEVGRDQSFFDLGGDSLAATRLVELVAQRLGAELSLGQVFSAAGVADLALAIEADRSSPVEEGVV